MRYYLIALIALPMLLAACGGKKTEAPVAEDVNDSAAADTARVDSLLSVIGDTPMPKAADELFDDFVFNFAASRKLQMERVVFPLKSTNGGKVETISREQWQTEHFFMDQDYYTLLFDSERQMEVVKDTSVHHAVVEKIFFNTSSITQYVFDRLRGAWMLTQIRTIPISQSANASFLTFYHQFATDNEFQTSHLNETVAFVGPDPDDDFAQMEGVITPDTWEAFAPELPERMIYNIVYGNPGKSTKSKVFVLRGIANGLEMEMTFRCTNGHWKLTKFTT